MLGVPMLFLGWLCVFLDYNAPLAAGVFLVGICGLPAVFWHSFKVLPKCPKCAKTIIAMHHRRLLKTGECPHCKSTIIRK